MFRACLELMFTVASSLWIYAITAKKLAFVGFLRISDSTMFRKVSLLKV